jgi:serine/threonine-protein kinase
MSAVFTRNRIEPIGHHGPRSERRAPPTRRLLADGATLGRYQVVRRIGWGGTSEVYEAAHLGLKKRVALKILRSDLSARDDVRARFLREGEIAARIQHPNVVDIIDVGAAEGIPFIVMEYLEGETLAALLARHAPVDAQHMVHIMLPVLAAVAAGHDGDVAHGDLKPGNIFLATDGRRRTMPKVLDFGVSRVMSDVAASRSTSTESRALGTPHYMSTEQARGAPVDARSDQFALGVILYEALTGRLPWKSQSILGLIHEVSAGVFDPPRSHRPELEVGLEEVITRAMQPDPAARFDSARAMGAALLRFASIRAREYWAVEFGSAAARASRTNEANQQPPAIESMQPEPAASTPPAVSGALAGAAGAIARSEPETLLYTPRRRRRIWPLAVIGAVTLAGAAAAALVLGGLAGRVRPESAHDLAAVPAPPAPSTFECSVRVVPSSARVEFDGKEVGEGRFSARLPIDGATHVVRLTAPGYEPMALTFRDAPPPAEIELVPLPPERAVEPAGRPELPASSPPVAPSILPGTRARVPGPLPTIVKATPTPSAAPPRAEPAGAPTTWPSAPRTDNRDPWSK